VIQGDKLNNKGFEFGQQLVRPPVSKTYDARMKAATAIMQQVAIDPTGVGNQ
jgi:hypothetical protein